jgi:excisionase family DNA binding protein
LLHRYASAGELLDVSDQTVRRLVADGELEAVRFRGSTRIPHESLLAFIERLRERA